LKERREGERKKKGKTRVLGKGRKAREVTVPLRWGGDEQTVKCISSPYRKGTRLIFLDQDKDMFAATQLNLEKLAGVPGRVLFSF